MSSRPVLLPDEHRYLTAATRRVARPFHYRWLLPAVCGTVRRRWDTNAYAHALAFAGLLVVYTGSWWSVPLAAGLAGLRLNVAYRCLVDLPAMAWALASAVTWDQGWWLVAIACSLVAGMVKESGPVFAALYAWTPVLLVGVAAPALRHLAEPGPDPFNDEKSAWILEHPFRAAWEFHKPLPAWVYVLPWGACLLGLTNGSWQLWTALAVAYGQCCAATDTVRLYQWAAPVLIAQTVPTIDGRWWVLVVALHLVNPFRTEGL